MKSMTGYGSGDASFPGGRAHVEIRAVNHRFLEVKTALPREFLPLEQEVRDLVSAQVKRGRVDLSLTFSGRSPRAYTVQPNVELARAYYAALSRLQRELGLGGEVDRSWLTSHTELLQLTEKSRPTAEEWAAARQALQQALTALERQRTREGKFLRRDLRARIGALGKIKRKIQSRSRTARRSLREKLRERVSTLLQGTDIDQSRLLQEVAALVQKTDITEELVRFHSHLDALAELSRTHGPVGKRLDFLLQELQREINTIGAKADDAAIRHLVVAAKEEVEKLREQAQNVE
jgi:uncharacterized protein (TIGR00255 family)